MIHQSTIELLKEMRFSGIATESEKQRNSAKSYRELLFEDRLAMLVDAEWNRRQSNKYLRVFMASVSRSMMQPLKELNITRIVI